MKTQLRRSCQGGSALCVCTSLPNCKEQEELGAVTATRNNDSSALRLPAAFGTYTSGPRQCYAVWEMNAVQFATYFKLRAKNQLNFRERAKQRQKRLAARDPCCSEIPVHRQATNHHSAALPEVPKSPHQPTKQQQKKTSKN